jgi:hypothetical protein
MNENNDTPLLRSVRELKAYFDSKRSSLPVNDAITVDEAIDSLMDSVRALEEQKAELDGLSELMQNPPARVLPENVIPLRRIPSAASTSISEVNDKRWILKLDCLIESRHISEIHKMAMELHSASRRYAFLEYRDLDQNTRQSLPALLKLGAITLFIPSILDLTFGEQSTLLSVAQQSSLNRPLLMVGSTQSFSDLRGEPGVNTDFLATLARAYIKLSRPFHEYKEQGLIHFFLDSLS